MSASSYANRLAPKRFDAPAFPGDDVRGSPGQNRLAPAVGPSGNALAPQDSGGPVAIGGALAPPMPSQLAAAPAFQQMPATAPAQAPADPRAAQVQQVLAAAEAADLTRHAEMESHYVAAIGTLLSQPGDITMKDMKAAAATAIGAKAVSAEQVASVMGRLPTSNQGALRTALAGQLRQSLQDLVAIHAEAQTRGLDLPAMMRANVAPGSSVKATS